MRIIKLILVCALVLFTKLSFANQVIDFSNEVIARNFLLDKTWICKMLDSLGKGQGFWTFDYVNGLKVRGEVTIPQYIACNSDSLKGRLSGNTLKYTSKSIFSSCVSVDGFFNFYFDNSGEIKAKGKYTYGSTRRRGTYVCEPIELMQLSE